jgi:predicted hydrocarbon binding protein
MTVSRHISMDDEHLEKIKPYLTKYHGNFGGALKELIDKGKLYRSSKNAQLIDIYLLHWMLEQMEGILIPDNLLNELIVPFLQNDSMKKCGENLNCCFHDIGLDVHLDLKCDNDTLPSVVIIEIKGQPNNTKFAAKIASQYLVNYSLHHSPFEIRSVTNYEDSYKVDFAISNEKEAQKSLIRFFGDMDEIINVIKTRPDFWRSIIKKHVLCDYSMVTVHRNCFEDLAGNKIPTEDITIENLANKPIREIPHKEMLSLIKKVYETSKIVDKLDIENDSLIVSHSYRKEKAINRLKNSFIILLESNGHLYDAKCVANKIVLTHRPDVGIKINEIVNDLKFSNSGVDHQLIMFMAFIKGLKDIPDVPLSLTVLGRRIGKSLMQEYETENNIKKWDLEVFQKALEKIDSKLQRESEWKLEEKNLLYTIRKCKVATDGNIVEAYSCHIVRETFKGAMSYAFGNRAELQVKKLLTHGDNVCQVLIRIQ